MNETFGVKERSEFYGYVFNKHYSQMAGLKASYYYLREHSVLPVRVKTNRFYADELRYIDRAVHEVARDMEMDKYLEVMKELYDKYGHQSLPRMMPHNDGLQQAS